MRLKTKRDIKRIVADFGETTVGDGDWYFIIKERNVDRIREWLENYTYTADGEWLNYTLVEVKNQPRRYILNLYCRY